MSEVADGPEMNVIGRSGPRRPIVEPRDGLGHQADDLVVADDAKVVVGQQGDGAPALARAAVQDDRPGLGDAQRTGRKHAVALSRSLIVSPGSRSRATSGGAQPSGKSAGTTSRFTPRAGTGLGDGTRQVGGRDRADAGLVLADAVDEVLDDAARACDWPSRCDSSMERLGASTARRVADRQVRADLREHGLACLAH